MQIGSYILIWSYQFIIHSTKWKSTTVFRSWWALSNHDGNRPAGKLVVNGFCSKIQFFWLYKPILNYKPLCPTMHLRNYHLGILWPQRHSLPWSPPQNLGGRQHLSMLARFCFCLFWLSSAFRWGWRIFHGQNSLTTPTTAHSFFWWAVCRVRSL